MCLRWICACSSQYFKKDTSQNSREIWNLSECNCTLTHNRLDPKQIIKYLPKTVVWSFLPSVSCLKSHCDDMNFKFQTRSHFWAISSHKIKINSLCSNLVPRPIQICRIQRFTFSVFDQKYSFWINLVQKIKIVSLSWNLVPI